MSFPLDVKKTQPLTKIRFLSSPSQKPDEKFKFLFLLTFHRNGRGGIVEIDTQRDDTLGLSLI